MPMSTVFVVRSLSITTNGKPSTTCKLSFLYSTNIHNLNLISTYRKCKFQWHSFYCNIIKSGFLKAVWTDEDQLSTTIIQSLMFILCTVSNTTAELICFTWLAIRDRSFHHLNTDHYRLTCFYASKKCFISSKSSSASHQNVTEQKCSCSSIDSNTVTDKHLQTTATFKGRVGVCVYLTWEVLCFGLSYNIISGQFWFARY